MVPAMGGEEGLELARQLKPAVITLDVMMPGSDGWNVLRTLKADPDLAAIPVVMLTIIDDKNMGFSLGAAEYLTKPVDRERLIRVIRRFSRDGQRGRALIVDDDEAARVRMRELLRGESWEVTEAGNGVEGLEVLGKGMPDLILLDLMMPEMNGFEFLAALHAREGGQQVPVVVVTGARPDAGRAGAPLDSRGAGVRQGPSRQRGAGGRTQAPAGRLQRREGLGRGQDPAGRGQRTQPGHAVPPAHAAGVHRRRGGGRGTGPRARQERAPRPHPDGHEPPRHRRLGNDAAVAGGSGDCRGAGDCPDGTRHGRRPGTARSRRVATTTTPSQWRWNGFSSRSPRCSERHHDPYVPGLPPGPAVLPGRAGLQQRGRRGSVTRSAPERPAGGCAAGPRAGGCVALVRRGGDRKRVGRRIRLRRVAVFPGGWLALAASRSSSRKPPPATNRARLAARTGGRRRRARFPP